MEFLLNGCNSMTLMLQINLKIFLEITHRHCLQYSIWLDISNSFNNKQIMKKYIILYIVSYSIVIIY